MRKSVYYFGFEYWSHAHLRAHSPHLVPKYLSTNLLKISETHKPLPKGNKKASAVAGF